MVAMINLLYSLYYLYWIWMPTWLHKLRPEPRLGNEAFGLNTCGLILLAFSFIFGGWLGDRFGLRKMCTLGVVLCAVVAVPGFWILETKSFWWAAGVTVVFAICYGVYVGPLTALFYLSLPDA